MHPHPIESLISSYFDLQEIKVCLKSEWASSQNNYRQNIREYLHLNFKGTEQVLNLDLVPKINGYSISISHSKEVGGFVIVKSNKTIGFDIEARNRIRIEHVQRVSEPSEIAQMPHPAVLWSAKEAAFKSLLHQDQPLVITDIEIGKWAQPQAMLFTCELTRVKNNSVSGIKGIAAEFQDQVFAFFLGKECPNALAVD